MRNLPARARSAFTLIELLVVIAIIGILAALLLVAVARFSDQGVALQATSDIRNLTIAANNFKAKYGFFPPSKITLSDNPNNMDAISRAYITTMWPRIDFSGASGLIDWAGIGQKGTYTLTGDQCLVFFLGGIPDSIDPQLEPPPPRLPGRRACRGFSSNVLNPTNFKTGTIESFYQFDNSRLILPYATIRRNDVYYGGYFYSYADPYDFHVTPLNPRLIDPAKDNRIPYAYFSSNKRKDGYNPAPTRTPGQTPGTPPGGDCPTLLPDGPYFEPSTVPPRYYNPTTFQIISAGKDGLFGLGGIWPPPLNPNPPPSVLKLALDKLGEDNQSNFFETVLGGMR